MCFFIVVNPQFSEAELALYTKRFENGYDLHDARYEEWLNWKSDEIISSGPFSKHIENITQWSIIKIIHGMQ